MRRPVARIRPTRRRVLLVIIAVLVVAGVWSVVCALIARSHLDAARADFAAVQADPPADLTALSAHLTRDAALAHSAARDMDQPGPWLVSHLPVIGRSFRAERVISQAAAGLITSVEPVVRDAGALSSGHGSGIDLATLGRLQADLAAAPRANASTQHALDALDFGWTPPFVSRLGETATAQLDSAFDGLGTAAGAIGAMRGVLGGSGPRTVMVALENNAELRGTGGLISSFALGTADHGTLTLGRFDDVSRVARDPSYQRIRTVPAAPDFVRAYHSEFLANTTVWRNANMSSDAPESAQVMSELAGISLHRRPDVVILLDVPAMSAIVQGTGQVLHLPDGQTVAGDQLTRALLLDSYGTATLNIKAEERRKAALDAAAGRVFAQVSSATPSVGLLRALAGAASGRHLVIWSDRPAEETALTRAGIAGAVQPGPAALAMVTDQDLGSSANYGNKLDYYVRRRLDMKVQVGAARAAVTESLTLTNDTPSGLGPYIAGKAHPGRLNELVAMALPPAATLGAFTSGGDAVPAQVLPADGTREIRTLAEIEPRTSETWTLTYTMPVQHGAFSVVGIPQPLATPATFDLSVTPAAGVRLVGTGPTVVTDGRVSRSGPWDGQVTVDLRVASPPLLSRIRSHLDRFWHYKIHF